MTECLVSTILFSILWIGVLGGVFVLLFLKIRNRKCDILSNEYILEDKGKFRNYYV